MAEDKLWLLRTNEDGDVSFRQVDTKDLAEYSGWFSESDVGSGIFDLAQSVAGPILIKGHIVVPRPKTVVTEYEVD